MGGDRDALVFGATPAQAVQNMQDPRIFRAVAHRSRALVSRPTASPSRDKRFFPRSFAIFRCIRRFVHVDAGKIPGKGSIYVNRIRKSDWTKVRAAHLLNRAGFGGFPTEIRDLFEMGPEGAVSSLVNFKDASVEPPAFTHEASRDLPDRRKMRDADEEERRKMQRVRRQSNLAGS